MAPRAFTPVFAGYSVIRPPVPPNLAAATRRCSLRNYDAATAPRWRERVVYHFSKVPRPIQQMPVSFSSSSRRRRRAIIIGGSMSGLFAAAFLRQKGWDADVYERSTVELVGRGAGITSHPELLDALRQSVAGTRDLGVQVEKRIALDRDGRVIAEKYLPQILTSWDRLQRLLRETIDTARYHLGHAFERVEQDGSGVVVHFAGGRSERADILIRSSVRAQVAPAIQPIYSG